MSGNGVRRKRSTVSAGCLVVAEFPDGPGYLLVHPSGPYNRNAPWSIAKGAPELDESLEDCAIRETREETGVKCRIVRSLGNIRYTRSRKTIHGYLAEALEQPKGRVIAPPSWEVDHVQFFRPEEALRRVHPDQRPFIERALTPDASSGETVL